MIAALDRLERWTQHSTERSSVVAHDGQSAASLRTVQGERPDDDVPAGAHGSQDTLAIGGAILLIGQEMKSRTIVPHIVRLGRLPRGDVRDRPFRLRASRTQPSLGSFECLAGEIEDGDGPKSFLQECIDQPRCPAADIDDRCIGRDPRGMNEIEGDGRAFFKPAYTALALGPFAGPIRLPLFSLSALPCTGTW